MNNNNNPFQNMQNYNFVNPLEEQSKRILRQQERQIRAITKAREEREAEELRRHNELVDAINRAAENGATIQIGDNARDIQIQQNTVNSSQEMNATTDFDYKQVLDVLREIKDYVEMPKFKEAFKDNADNVISLINGSIEAAENKENPSLIKKSLNIIKDLAIGATGSLIASGILALLQTIQL